LYAGRKRRGLWLIGVSLLLMTPAVVLVALLFGPWEVSGIGLAVDLIRPFFQHPALVLTLLAAVIALLGFRAFTVIDAFMLAKRPASGSADVVQTVAAMVVILAFVALPHGWASVQALALHDFVTADFLTDPGQAGSTTTTASTTTELGGTSTSPTTTEATTTTQAGLFGGKDRVTIALLGGDAGPDRTGIRTDTIIIVSVDTATGSAAMFSIPRNQVQWPIPPGIPAYDAIDCHCIRDITNTVYQFGLQNPTWFPGGPNTGGNAVKAVFGYGMDLEIDYFAVVDLLGFIEVVDAIGGVDINVTKPVFDHDQVHPDGTISDVSIPVGWHHLDGKMALAYARARSQDDDYHRMDRQRCVLEAVASEIDPITLLRRFSEILPIVQANLRTDIPVQQFPDLLELLEKVDTSKIVSVRLMPYAPEFEGTPTSYSLGTDENGYWIPNLTRIKETVRATIENPEQAMSTLNFQSLEDACSAPTTTTTTTAVTTTTTPGSTTQP
jgi:LCP family protein required for cell wall assembly